MTDPRRSNSLNAAVAVAVASAVAVMAIAGCGGGDDATNKPRLTVTAATSLERPFTEIADGFDRADVRLSFAGSDQLAAQIRAGASPDVVASASGFLLRRLAGDDLVETPVVFALNRLVVAAPRDGRVKRFADLGEPGVKIAIGTRAVPVGSYARRALVQVPARLRKRIEANLATDEPDAAAVIGRVRGGAVDAGFVYATDVKAVRELRAIAIPARLRPTYAAAVVIGSKHPEAARAFVLQLRLPRAAVALARTGFEIPP